MHGIRLVLAERAAVRWQCGAVVTARGGSGRRHTGKGRGLETFGVVGVDVVREVRGGLALAADMKERGKEEGTGYSKERIPATVDGAIP